MKTCTVCLIEKPLSEYWSDRRRKNGLMARCKACGTARMRGYRQSRPSYEKEVYQRYKTKTRERHLRRKYGIDLDGYREMLAKQNGKCAICGDEEENQFKQVFHVDHDHITGAVRGLLCRGCNHMLGVVNDRPELLLKAIAYIVPQVAAEVIGAYMSDTPSFLIQHKQGA